MFSNLTDSVQVSGLRSKEYMMEYRCGIDAIQSSSPVFIFCYVSHNLNLLSEATSVPTSSTEIHCSTSTGIRTILGTTYSPCTSRQCIHLRHTQHRIFLHRALPIPPKIKILVTLMAIGKQVLVKLNGVAFTLQTQLVVQLIIINVLFNHMCGNTLSCN